MSAAGIKVEDVAAILGMQARWVNQHTPKWHLTKSMYCDKAYEQGAQSNLLDQWRATAMAAAPLAGIPPLNSQNTPAADGDRAFVQVNLVKPWIGAMMAALFYKGAQFVVTPDPGTEKKALSQDEIDAVAILVNTFFGREDVEAAGEVAFQAALTYDGGGAFKMGYDPDEEDPLSACWLEVVLPWEFVVDRKAVPGRERYAGHLYWMTREEYVDRFEGELPETDLATPPNVVDDGASPVISPIREPAPGHVYVFELYDLTVRNKDKKLGKVRFFRVKNPGRQVPTLASTADTPQLDEITPKSEEWTGELLEWEHGIRRVVVNIQPVVVDNPPDQRLFNVAPVNGVVELNRELNLVVSSMATAFRRDLQRVLGYDPTKVTPDALAAIKSGEDMVMFPVAIGEGGVVDVQKVASFLPQQPVSATVLQYRKLLMESKGDVQMTADFTRGEQGQYVSATEATLLNSYTETTIGRIRKRVNDALGKMVKMFLRFMEETIPASGYPIVLPSKEIIKVKPKMLQRGWNVSLRESSSTPVAQNAKKAEFLQIAPQVMAAVQAATAPGAPPELKRAAEKILDFIVQLWDLPASLNWAALTDGQPDEEAGPEPTPAPPTPEPAPEAGVPAPAGEAMPPQGPNPVLGAIANAAT